MYGFDTYVYRKKSFKTEAQWELFRTKFLELVNSIEYRELTDACYSVTDNSVCIDIPNQGFYFCRDLMNILKEAGYETN